MIQNPGKKRVTIMFSSMLKGGRSLMLAFCLLIICSSAALAQTETLSTGSYIINMGVVPQTQSNALKPYGLVYDLLKNYNVQVKWVISQSKVKDGADFTYNGVQYKGGTFIIPAQYRNAAVNNRISFFGVTGTTTTSPLTVNVTHTLTTAPKWTLDFQNGDIAAGFFADAGIPASAYDTKTPAQLNGCDEIYVMPHADADWSYYGPLRNWVLNFRGSFWGGCRTGSQIENLFNPAVPSEQMNFLSNNVGAAGNALVPYDSHADGTPPFIHQFPTSPVAQYMGITDDAHQNGSEQIYLPKLNGSWRASTQVITYDPTQSNVPALSPGPASAIVFGRAYGNPLSGLVMYEGGHDIGGTGTQEIAAQRAFWNFSFLSSTEVLPGGCVGSISDFVWNDANGNGLQDNGEQGIQGVQVTLTRPDLSTVTTTTSATGFYQFGNLATGTYKVTFPTTIAGGYALTNANIGSDDSKDSDPDRGTGLVNNIVIGPGQNNPTIDAGYVLANLTLGNKVFYDLNRSGFYDAGDGLVAGATVRLYADANNDNIPDGGLIQAQQTNAMGEYAFTSLTPGNYIVGVVIPSSYAITVVNGGDPDNNIDNDNNAITIIAGEARGNAISLASGAEPGGNINNTYDFGFYNPIAPPNGGENCFSGTNTIVWAKSFWNVNVNAQTVTLRVTFSKKFVDNTYGTNAIGWPNGHTWANLTGSDHLQWSIRDANGIEKLAFKQDYVSASTAFPSGFGTLGFGGDGGTPTVGLATDVLSFRTSIATNFNDYGYVLTTNSPATDTNYTPNPAQPNWIYDVWYEVTVKASVFGNAGFGFVNVASVHASPSKTGNNTEIITNNPCASGSIGDRVWNDLNKNGVQDAGEVGLAGIVVSLYEGTTNKVLASTVTDGYGNYKFSNLETSVAGINYQVRFSLEPGYRFSPSNGVITVANNSDANIVTGRTTTITLTNAVPNVTYVDAGMYYTETARIGDFVWNDINKNGIQEANEPGIAGVNVMLYTNTNALYRSTITASNGLYYFNEVPAGTYYIKVSPPIGYQVSPKDASADNTDSDIDPVTRQTPNFVVVAGTSNLTLDAGLHVTTTTGASASLGDKVWEDLNNNNLQDAGEPGIANVTVQLYNNTNVLQATITTDAFGNYIFNSLNPGSYYVKFGLPSGYGYVTANVGANDAIDSDADGTGTSQTVTLVADEINTTVDAGLRRTSAGAALGDFVWYDLNKNGVQDGGSEAGVPGITVLLYNPSNVVVATTTTNMNGFYLFTGLPAATTYTVGFENIPAGYGFSPNNGAVTVTNNSDVNPSTGRTGNVTTGAAGTTVSYVDAGLIFTPKVFDSKATVGDRVWNDLNNNGIQDAGEPGIPAVTVTLYAANGTTVIAATITDALGNYLFTNLDAGTYVVGFGSLPAGYVFATKDAGTNDEKDSDADATTGKTAAFTLAQGEINLSLDAGARNTSATVSSIGNFVWFDLNNNGLQDSGEPGAAGISVELTNMAGLVIGTTTTSATGEYRFRDLPANNYYVKFTNLPAGFAIGTKNIGADDAIDSDPNVPTSKTDIIVLPASANDLTWDMGIVTTTRASVGDYVWNDNNMNGIQDAAETGVSGVTVTLFNNSNVAVAQTVTDANGFYLFSNVLPGTYSVGFGTIPASSAFTTQNAAGSTAANNSDADQTGRTATFTLVGGQSKTDVDAGLVSLKAAVGDYVWNDANNDGLQDASEAGVAGITVTMFTSANATIGDADDVARASAVTDANGYYFINNVSVAATGSQFYMRFTDLQSAYDFTLPLVGGTGASNNSKVTTQPVANGRTGFFTLAPGQVYRDVDAGIVINTASIGDRVWNDTNGNGIQDPNEVGIAGVTIVLYNSLAQPIATTTTDAFGIYKFSGLAADNYTLKITPPSNYTLSAKTQGGDTNTDSDFDPITYTTATVTLAAGQNRTDIDAGLKFTQSQPASVGDRVWLDNNGDGIQDAGEPGVSNVLVTLYNGTGTPVRYTYTDVNGYYLFTDVTPGSYTVGVSLPPAFVFTANNGAVSNTTNSDIIPATGRTASFTVNAGDQIRYVDAGLKQQQTTNGSIGDFVWNDLNQDGQQDSGEPGIADVAVRLINAVTNAVVATTATDVTGKYIFNDVLAGNYLVEFVTPAGYTTTSKLNNNVEASATDSDVDPATSKTASFILAAGQRITAVDAGYWQTSGGTSMIGDRVWLDANQNGIQDIGEKDVPGITVVLYDGTNTAIKQTVTDASGNYLFTNLAAGNYTVGFSNIPAGYTFTTQGLGTAATGSDANPATGRTATITLAAAQTNLDVDAGIRSAMAGTASIGNRVWNDLNNNGLQDANEPGIAGVTAELLDANGNPIDSDPVTAGIQPTTRLTNALGEYLFTGLAAGDYKVRFGTLPAGFNASPKAAGTNRDIDSDGNAIAAGTSTTDMVSVAAGEERLDIDLGLHNPTAPSGQIGDYVWFDSNNNGVQDATEQGVPGVSVSLLNASNNVLATTVTDANGNYLFANLADATYAVRFSNLPAGFVFSPKDQGGNDNLDSDADPATGQTGTYTITAGNTNLTVDAGIYSTRAALGDYVWFDADNDGTQDATEKGIAGVTVTLYDANNTAVTSTVTDQNGRYFFSNLDPATYTVGFGTIPTQLVFTIKDAVVAGDLADSDVDPATGKTGPVTLTAGQVNLSVDAGLRPFVPASIGDFVWYDLDRDGIQDPNEPGVPGIVATLYNAANQVIGSAITDGNGFYQISNVPAGTDYYVLFSNKPDPAAPWTLQNVGGAGANNNSKADATGKTGSFNVAEGQNITNIDAGLYRLISLSGNVWHDANGMDDNLVNKTSTTPIPVGLRVYLVNFSNGAIIEGVRGISSFTGTYLFQNVNVNTNYRIYLTNQAFNVGTVFPNSGFNTLPGTWTNTGEKLGITPGSDGIANGWLNVTVGVSSVVNANFGIKEGGGGGQQ